MKRNACDGFIVRLANLQYEAGTLGLHRSMHMIHEAAKVAGYEYAELLMKDRKPAKKGKALGPGRRDRCGRSAPRG